MLFHVFYKSLRERDKMYGLELIDLYILIAFFNLSFLVSESFLINVMLTAIIFFVLKIYKKNKPRNYTTDLINYWMSKKVLIVRSTDSIDVCSNRR